MRKDSVSPPAVSGHSHPHSVAARNRGQRVRRLLAGLVASGLSIALLLFGIEFVARRLALHVGHFSVPTPDNCLQRSALLGMEFVPNCATEWHDGVLTGYTPTSFTTNELGLRDDPIMNDGRRRILAIGDSCTWGWQVAQHKAYPQVLQTLVDRFIGPDSYRVINAGVPGYASTQGLSYLRERGLALKPEIVIIAYGFNDALLTGDLEHALATQQRFLTFIKLDDYLLDTSTFWGWARTRLRDRAGPPPPSDVRVPVPTYEKNVLRMIDLVREHGARPVVLTFEREEGAYGRANVDVASRAGVPVLVYRGPRLDIIHPTALGYSMLAKQLFDRLQGEGYLPPGETS